MIYRAWPEDFRDWLKAVSAAPTLPVECMVAVALSRCMANGRDVLSLHELSKLVGCEIATVGPAVRRLRKMGFIRTPNNTGVRGGCHGPNQYEISMPEAVNAV